MLHEIKLFGYILLIISYIDKLNKILSNFINNLGECESQEKSFWLSSLLSITFFWPHKSRILEMLLIKIREELIFWKVRTMASS